MAKVYVDYSVFNSDKFDARQYANSLLLSTTDRDEQNIDFSSAQNKARFDLEEVDAALRSEIEANWEELLERTELASSASEDVAVLEKSLRTAASAYDKIHEKTVTLYEQAEPLYEALVNLASTASLLRSLDSYMEHIVRLEAASDVSSITEVLIDLERCVQENRALMQLRIVISNLPRVDSKRAGVLHDCQLSISRYENLATAMSALHKLDPAQLRSALKVTIRSALDEASREFKSGLEVNYNIRRLQNTDNTKATAMFVQNMESAFDHMGFSARKLQTIEDACPPELLQGILDELCDASASITQYFWREISGQISAITRDATRNNQWILRTLRSTDIESVVSHGLPRGTMEYSVVFGSLSRR